MTLRSPVDQGRTDLAALERARLADLFEQLGPQAPTILPGWTAEDLLDHLLVREGAPTAMLDAERGGLLSVWASGRRRRLTDGDWTAKVARFRQGAPRTSLFRPLDRLANGAEHLIHHEDLRRAQPGWRPRRFPRQEQEQIWALVARFAPVMARVKARLILVSPLGGHRVGRGGPGRPSIRVHGDPCELLLWIYGRDDVAQVRISADDAGRRALAAGRRGA